MLAHCSPSSKWVPGGNTGAKGCKERNWPPYHMPTAQDKCPSNGHSPNVQARTWDSYLPCYFIRNKSVRNMRLKSDKNKKHLSNTGRPSFKRSLKNPFLRANVLSNWKQNKNYIRPIKCFKLKLKFPVS